MITRFGALDSPDIQAPDKYLKRILPNSTKFFTGHSSQISWLARTHLDPKFETSRRGFQKKWNNVTFPEFYVDSFVVWYWELVCLMRLTLRHLIYTRNIFIWSLENYLLAAEVNFFRKIRKKLQLNIGIFSHLSIKYAKKCSFTSGCKIFHRVRKYTFNVFIKFLNTRAI